MCVSFLFVVKTALMSVSTRSVEAVMFLEVFSLQIWALPSDAGSTWQQGFLRLAPIQWLGLRSQVVTSRILLPTSVFCWGRAYTLSELRLLMFILVSRARHATTARWIFVQVSGSNFPRASSHHPPRDNLPEPGPSSHAQPVLNTGSRSLFIQETPPKFM